MAKRRSFCLIGLREPRQIFSRRPGPEVGYAHDSLRRRCLSGHRARSINSLTFQRSGVAPRLLPFTVMMERRGGPRWARVYLERWIRDPESQRPRAHMPKLELEAENVTALAAYLSSLR